MVCEVVPKILGVFPQKILEPTILDEIQKIQIVNVSTQNLNENLSKYKQNFPKRSGMAVGLERVHVAPTGNTQVAGRAATMRWWQQGVQDGSNDASDAVMA